jgi:hypothetical protein
MTEFDARCGHLFSVVLATLVSVMTFENAHPTDYSSGSVSQPSEVQRLVDALANRNPQPRIVKEITNVPIFSENYDWKEQERVSKAIHVVAKRATPEMWETLVLNEKDSRYCLTFANENGFARNESVGGFCGWIAYEQLVFPVERNLNRLNRQLAAKDLKQVSLSDIDDLKKWREARSKKAFFELQIEVCQQGIEKLGEVKDVSPDAKAECRARLESEIDTLRRTKAGIFGEFKFPGDRYDVFDAERARRIRAKLGEQNGA